MITVAPSRPACATARVGLLLGAALFVLMLPRPAQLMAQTVQGSRPNERLVAVLSGLSPSQEVQIVTPRYLIDDAIFVGLRPGYLDVTQDGTPVPLDLTEVRAVSVRANHALQGTLWGAAAGILIGGVTGMMVASFDCTTASSCNETEQAGAVRWATVFGVGGAVGGFVFGRYSVYWKPIFP